MKQEISVKVQVKAVIKIGPEICKRSLENLEDKLIVMKIRRH